MNAEETGQIQGDESGPPHRHSRGSGNDASALLDAEEIARRIAAIQEDQERGATQLAGEAVRLLADLAADPRLSGVDFADIFPRVARGLANARPSMASLLNAAGSVVAAWREAGGAANVEAARSAARGAALRWGAKQERAAGLIADHTAETISGVAITLSYSSTVLRALEVCWERGVLTGVIVAESRPLFEGRRTAAALAAQGIPTVLITDAEMGVFAAAAAAAVVGADTLMPSGYLVNKTGTNLLALVARRSRIPFYALAEAHKILPGRRRRSALPLEEKGPEEVLPEPIPGVAVRNVYFDVTPARYITGYLTEQGLLNRRDVAALSRQADGRVLGSEF